MFCGRTEALPFSLLFENKSNANTANLRDSDHETKRDNIVKGQNVVGEGGTKRDQ